MEPVAALVLVHGLGEHCGRYQNLVDYLVPRGVALYGFDLRGHGRSAGQRGHIDSWDEMRGDLSHFLHYAKRAEGGDRPLFLLGHSLGGLIVLEYGLHADRAAPALAGVIASAPGLSAGGLSPLLILLARVLSRFQPGLTLKTGLDATTLSRDPAVVTAYQEDPLVHGLGTPRLTTESLAAIDRVFAAAPGWRAPLLTIYGTADRLVPPEPSLRFFDQVPIEDKTLIAYEGGFHECHNDIVYERVMADLHGWLSRHLA
jgi:alpha-beta hydrolase superfamily lysophospholipase